MDEEPTVESIIREALPDEADREHRICLLRLWHAAERTQWAIDSLGRDLADYLEDPEPLYSGRLLQGSAEQLALKLAGFAAEVRKSSRRLDALARERWIRTEGTNGGA